MKIVFLGTRGEIEARTRRHRRHTSMLVAYHGRRVMIDCGLDWIRDVWKIRPHAIVITHAHPDHAWGLRDGAPCPVYATRQSWKDMADYPVHERHTIKHRSPLTIEGIRFEAYPVEHSTRCPAVGYRVTAGKVTIFYVPDLVYIRDRKPALQGAAVYIGDGATLARPLVRRRGERLIGHVPVRTQLTWCEKVGVPEAIITHCGSQIVEGDERAVTARLREWGKERGIKVSLAHDGMERVLR
jgi:phosphoribosyl 1,2-cyclic phosphodiesterase